VRDLDLVGVQEARTLARCAGRTFGPWDLVQVGVRAGRSLCGSEPGTAVGSDFGTLVHDAVTSFFRVFSRGFREKSRRHQAGQGRGLVDLYVGLRQYKRQFASDILHGFRICP
jgi:hypothetical protein